ncbi:MAG: trigger factor [Trueperaceae bacterium]|nr:MAG: trigger factor [Trueperaceae bacterium]
MQAQLKDKQDVSATFTVTVPADVVDAAFERVLGALARQVKVPGFRPGRAPRGVLIQRIGADALAEEVREALVDEHYPQAVRELDLLPVHAHFHGEPPTAGAEFTFEVHADLYPTFELPDFDSIELDATAPEISDDDVTETVERLREEHATLVPVERPVEPGDVLTVETLGEGGGSNMPVDLGRTEPHLVEQLTGRSMGDELTLDLGVDPAAPAAADGDSEAGSEADSEAAAQDAPADEGDAPRRSLAIRIVDVKAKELPETDDAFAATLGFESWDATLSEIRSSLASQADRDAFSKQREAFVDQLMAATDMGLPKSMVARRQRALIEELKDDLEQRGMTLQGYLEELEARDARAGFDQELTQAAERAVKRDLVLEAVLERVGTEIGDAEFEAGVRMMAMRERKDVARFKQEMGEEWLRNYRFLLNRDRALREVVAAKTGRDRRDGSADAEEAGAASAGADAATEASGHDDAEGAHEDEQA